MPNRSAASLPKVADWTLLAGLVLIALAAGSVLVVALYERFNAFALAALVVWLGGMALAARQAVGGRIDWRTLLGAVLLSLLIRWWSVQLTMGVELRVDPMNYTNLALAVLDGRGLIVDDVQYGPDLRAYFPPLYPLLLAVLLGLGGLAAGWLTGGAMLTGWLLAYVALSVAYSLRLKAALVADAIALAMLYTIRIWIGGASVGVAISYWLALFSLFLFLSLAYLKRYIEIQGSTDPAQLVKGRGYVGGDLDLVMALGVGAGMVAILVLALFAHDPVTLQNYAAPDLLLLACLPLLYWLNRVWLMARRGEVEGDPVAVAIRDRRSLVLGALIGAIFIAALLGPDPLLDQP